jgi:cell division protein ZapA (FtsZ GTPase activity inhibitor)
MELNSFEVPVFGQVIRFKSDKDISSLQVLVEKFQKKLDEIQKVSPTVDPLKILVLLSLNLLDEFDDFQKKQEGEKKLIEEKIEEILAKISHNLGEENE